jgi:V-type H+-transporting ATPase subunit a
MEYYNLIIPRESSWNVMNELGELECLHLIDYDPLLPVINRPFANYVKRFFLFQNFRCDDSLFKLNVISAELRLFKKQVIYCEDVKPLISYFKSTIKNRAKASHTYFEEIEAMVESRHKMVTD